MRHLLSPLDFSVEETNELLDLAADIEKNPDKYTDICKGKKIATLFYEPSTRRAKMSRMVQICRWAGGGRLRCMALPPCFVLLPHGMHHGRRLCAGRKCGTL